jgi:hypothetical protein
MVSLSTLLTESSYGWVYPIRYKDNKLLVVASGYDPSTNVGSVQVKEYDTSVSPPSLIRSSPVIGNATDYHEFDAVAFDEVNKKIILGGYNNKIIIMDYNDFTKYTVLSIPNGSPFWISITIDIPNNRIIITGDNQVAISPYDLFLAGNPSWTIKDLNSILNLGYTAIEVHVRIFKGVWYALIVNAGRSGVTQIKTTLAKSTDLGNTWTIVRQTSSTTGTSIYLFPKFDANDFVMAYSFVDTDDHWKVAITTDGVNFVVVDEGYNDTGITGGEGHLTVHTFGKLVVSVHNFRFDAGVPAGGPKVYQVRIYDTNGNLLYDSGDVSATYPGHDGRQGILDNYGRMVITCNTFNGSDNANATLVLISADIMPKLTLSLTGNTLTVTLTDQAGNPLSGKTVTLEVVKYISGANRQNTSPVTATTDSSGKATFTVSPNTWYQVVYVP